jgi:hypothetical protein
MESKSDNELGTASGFTVDEDDDGGFRWTAFGPAGTRQGTATSKEEAEAAARAAERELIDPAEGPLRSE